MANIDIGDIERKLRWVRDNFAKPVNQFIDTRGLREDATELINEYAPEPWRDPLNEAVATLDELISVAAGENTGDSSAD